MINLLHYYRSTDNPSSIRVSNRSRASQCRRQWCACGDDRASTRAYIHLPCSRASRMVGCPSLLSFFSTSLFLLLLLMISLFSPPFALCLLGASCTPPSLRPPLPSLFWALAFLQPEILFKEVGPTEGMCVGPLPWYCAHGYGTWHLWGLCELK